MTLECVSSKATSSFVGEVGSDKYLFLNVFAKSYSVEIGKSTSA